MPVFAYRALTGGGRARGGVIGAGSARAAWQELRARGVYPTDLREQAAGAGWAGSRLGAEELAAATRQLATLVGAGVPVAEALAAVAEQSEHPTLVRGLTVAEARLREGEPLADALAASPRVFPPLFRDLVRAGEASGALATVLARLADHTEASAALRARLRAALTYPAVMAAATVAVLVFLLAWVVPQLTQLFAETGTRLPLATRALIAVTSVVGRTWWLLLLAGAGGVPAPRRPPRRRRRACGRAGRDARARGGGLRARGGDHHLRHDRVGRAAPRARHGGRRARAGGRGPAPAPRPERARPMRRGFTLLEVMVVMFILGLLATLVAPRVVGRTDDARRTKAIADLKGIEQALNLYRLDSGGYPTTEQGLEALVHKPDRPPVPRAWNPNGYLERVPLDPWGHAYVYLADGSRYTLKCLGADGVAGGEGTFADLDGKDF